MPIENQPVYPPIVLSAPSQPGTLVSPDVPVPIDPNNPPWGLGGALLVLFGSLALQIGISLLFLLPFAIQIALRPDAPQNALAIALADKTAILFQVIAILPTHLASFALVWAVVTHFGKRPFVESLGLKWSGYQSLLGSVGLGIVLYGAGSGLAWLLGGDTPTKLEEIIKSSLAARYTLAAMAVLTAPLVEELIYRGVLYSALQKLAGVTPAVIIVLGIFTLIHVPQYWPNVGVIAAVGLLSVALTIVRAYSGRLLPCVVIHMVFNGVTAILLVIEPHLPKLTQTTEPSAGILWLLSQLPIQ